MNDDKAVDTFEEEAQRIAAEVATLVSEKMKDYGPKNIMNSVVEPEIAIAVRVNDKLARLLNLIKTGKTPVNESLIDTANDIIGYGICLRMVLDETFTLPLQEDLEKENLKDKVPF